MSTCMNCACCGETFMGESWEVCDSCHAAGCDPDANDCQIPECPDCNTRASWMTDLCWHSNCDGTCDGQGQAWADIEAEKRVSVPQIQRRRFRVPSVWVRMSRISKNLRSYVRDRRWDSSSRFVGDKPLLPCAPFLASYSDVGGYPLYYLARTESRYSTPTLRCLCPECASKAEYEDERIIGAEANWEDPRLHCDECDKRIESAYAEDAATSEA